MLAIETTGLSKKYSNKYVLEDFSITVTEGTIMALLGPNGAGKTTFVKAMLDLIPISSGNIFINGIKYKSSSAREKISYLPEKFSFYPFYSIRQVLTFYASMKGVSGIDATNQINSALSKLNIKDLEKQKISTLSKGQLQRVGIACSIIGDPKLLILDEPFSGLDPIGIKDIKTIIFDLKAKGTTIFINSHILSEIEKIADEVIIIDKGKCLAKGTLKDIAKGKQLEDFFYDIIKGN